MFLPEATVDSLDMADLADTRMVPRVVTVSAVCIRDQVLLGIPRHRRLVRGLFRMRHTPLLHSLLPEISIISTAGMNIGMASEAIATDTGVAGAMDILTLIRI
jgi:hypothetical protein